MRPCLLASTACFVEDLVVGDHLPEIQEGQGAIDARPTKRFFVRMLVRDIELAPAIVDLLDNSVDGAKRLAAQREEDDEQRPSNGDGRLQQVLEGHHVALTVLPDEFVIEDDCGGIELGAARDYAFRFGRPEDVDSVEGEVGQFGVGMKRALFKLGEHFTVTSVAADSRFVVEVSVREWLDDPEDWTFPIHDAVEEEHAVDERGTRIVVTDLLPSVAAEFKTDLFLQRLRDQIEFRHQSALAAGLVIRLNETPLRSRPLELLVSEGELEPRVVAKTLNVNGAQVEMKLYAGFVELADEGADTDDPDQFTGGGRAGWYLICNDRMLLFADKSRLTGWGLEVADYHPQYRRFRGYVYLTGSAAVMPWNTAKTAVDEDSSLWRLVRQEMVEALREARTVMNRMKVEVQAEQPANRPITTELAAARSVPLSQLAERQNMVYPPRPPRQPPTIRNITYAVPVDRYDEVRETLDAASAAEVGRMTFDYFYAREVEE